MKIDQVRKRLDRLDKQLKAVNGGAEILFIVDDGISEKLLVNSFEMSRKWYEKELALYRRQEKDVIQIIDNWQMEFTNGFEESEWRPQTKEP